MSSSPPGPPSRVEVAKALGVSPAYVAQVEAKFRLRLAAAVLKDPESPRHIARRAAAYLASRGL